MILATGNYELDLERRELRRDGVVIGVEPQVFDLLVYLVRNAHRVVSKDELLQAIWDGRVVSDATLTSRISSARRALGDSGERQHMIRTVARRGFRFVGDVRERVPGGPHGRSDSGSPAVPVKQKIQFCEMPDGVHLAVATAGHGPPLVKTANWLNHLAFDWQSPVWSPLFGWLAGRQTLIRYDERGTGLSDRDVPAFSFEAFVRDLETVVDVLDVQRFALLGISQGAPVAIAYAVQHPERVSRIVLCGGFARGWRKRGSPREVARAEASITLIRDGWGRDNPAARQMFTSLIIPDATLDEMRWMNDLERHSATPETAIRLLDVIGEIDVVEILSRVTVPVLIFHSREDARVPFEHGLLLARTIPNARFVPLESRNHLILSHEPAFERLRAEIGSFLEEDARLTAPGEAR